MSATDRDGLLSVSPDGLAIQARAEGAWAGGRGSLGVASGSGARAWWSATAADDGLARLGVALPGASFDLGTDSRGWGYGGTGRKAHGGSFAEYGGPWGRGDTVGVALDLAAAPPCLAFYKNGAPLGPAYELPAASPAFFPAAYLKNAELHLKFGGAADELPPGFAWLDALPAAAKATAAAAGAGGEAKKNAAPPPSTPPVALVLEPTRDLAEQAADTFFSLGARLPGVRTLCVTGGTAVGPQKAALAAGEVEVVVGTLGRVQELVDSRALSLASIRVIVLDEADRLLDSSAGGSGHGVAALVGSVPKGGAGSTRLQVCLFSATLQAACVTAAAAALCANPIHIDLKGGEGGPGGGPAPGTALPEGVDHVLISVDPRADRSWLQGQPAVPTDGVHAVDRGPDDTPLLSPDADSPEAWSEATKRLKPRLVARLADSLDMPQALIFVRTNHDAACLQAFLDGLAPGAPPSAGRRPDAARETGAEHPYSSAVLGGALAMEDRRAALAAFKAGTVRFLIATDVAARGIDVAALPYVINLTLPPADRAEDYVHRIGRVGRAGARGLAISLVASLPEKVWFVTRKGYRPWAACPIKAADTATTEEGGHTVWYDERAALKAVEARLGGEVLELGPDLSLPPALAARAAGGAGGVGYGGNGGEAAAAVVAEQKARLAALRPAVERLAALETEAQVAFFALQSFFRVRPNRCEENSPRWPLPP
jgi:ATP-dependent RNA helicase DDX1